MQYKKILQFCAILIAFTLLLSTVFFASQAAPPPAHPGPPAISALFVDIPGGEQPELTSGPGVVRARLVEINWNVFGSRNAPTLQ